MVPKEFYDYSWSGDYEFVIPENREKHKFRRVADAGAFDELDYRFGCPNVP